MAISARPEGQWARPTAIDEWLRQLLHQHAPDPRDLAQVKERAVRLEDLLKRDAEMGVQKTIVGGSVGKETAIAPARVGPRGSRKGKANAPCFHEIDVEGMMR